MSMLAMLRVALRGVTANRTRSFLTMLGILIGVASVIVLVAVGNGSAIAVAKRFDALGTNTLTITPGGFGRGARASSAASLTKRDLEALRADDHRAYIRHVIPIINAGAVSISFGESTTQPQRVVGTEAAMQEAGSWDVASGRFFDADEVTDRRRVAVIGWRVSDNLFGAELDPVGSIVRINGVDFEVVGTLKPKGTNGQQDQDDVVMAPWTAIRDTVNGSSTFNQIIVQAQSRSVTDEAQGVVTDVLTALHPTRNGQLGFSVLNQASLLQSSSDSSRTLTVLLAAVAAISLLVGGIGIMNIMLVTVTERTREIGIRKAVGAPKRAILGQFLMEAAVLGCLGGALGVVVGLAGSRFEIAGTQPVVRYDSVIVALAVAIAISVVFGLYPANRAASMRPIDALRHE